MEDDLAKEGIEILGYSSDGDSRLLKAMRIESGLSRHITVADLNLPTAWNQSQWFYSEFAPKRLCVQDTVHIGTKLRTR